MKKINLFLTILAAAAGFTNCAKVDLVENKEAGNGGTVVYATTDAVTKTTLASDYKVLWSTGDQIKFIKDGASSTTYTFTLSSGSGTSNGTFTCGETPVEGTYTVYYPATYDGSNWPAQTYVSATDISGALMKATATVSGGSIPDLTFTNEGGILRYTVKGSKTIKSINVKSASPALDVTLDCGTSGVALTAEGTVFNIALPAGTYSDATLTFTATDKSKATKAASSFTVTKNVVSLATFESSALSFIAPPAPDGFVDLGVTEDSGKPLYWAKCNLGATKAEDTGDYFAWGEIAPYYTTTGGWPASPLWKTGTTSGYAWQSYCGSESFAEWSTHPYDDATKILLPAYDAATAANPSWRTPKSNEFQSLKDNCYWEWTEDYNGTGVKGVIVYKAKAAGDKGKYGGVSGYTISDTHIFLPAAGYGEGTSRKSTSSEGHYWASTLSSNQSYGFGLYFQSDNINSANGNPRCYGRPVRPVTTEAALPAGALKGEFSVSATKKVHFSKGNLVATIIASGAPTAWKFATNQYDYIGEGGANKTIGMSEGDIDLFGWSTASTTYGISKSITNSDYSGDFVDWGKAYCEKNSITPDNTWRTLSTAEWQYLFNNHVKVWGQCNSVNGYFIAPDGFVGDASTLSSLVSDWTAAEAAGIVFLPAAGSRGGPSVYNVGDCGRYWSSTAIDSNKAYYVNFYSDKVSPDSNLDRYRGFSVRLITECQ